MSKTPVTIVQEYCAKINTSPQYDLVFDGTGSHNPLFTFKLTVNGVVAFGNGKSKKEAKHDAAQNVILLIPDLIRKPDLCTKVRKSDLEGQTDDITSPYQGALKENAIGDLESVCNLNKLPIPEYKIVGEEGPPHAKLFTYECHVSELRETASSRTKQQAKHLAAKLMLERLKKMLGEKLLIVAPETTCEKGENDHELNEKAKDLYKNTKKIDFPENYNTLISDYHKIDLSTIFGGNPIPLLKLSDYKNSDENFETDPISILDELKDYAEVSIEINLLPSNNNSVFIYVCELKSSPAFVHFGMNSNEEKSKQIAVHKMLTFLKCFCNANK